MHSRASGASTTVPSLSKNPFVRLASPYGSPTLWRSPNKLPTRLDTVAAVECGAAGRGVVRVSRFCWNDATTYVPGETFPKAQLAVGGGSFAVSPVVETPFL